MIRQRSWAIARNWSEWTATTIRKRTFSADPVSEIKAQLFTSRAPPGRRMIREMLESLEKNPLFSGGLTLMAIGSAGAILRKVPAQIAAFIERRLSLSLEIPDRDPAFRWIQSWMATQSYAKRARDLSLATIWTSSEPENPGRAEFDCDESSGPRSEAKFELSPAPGIHFMMYQNRILILRRTRRDLQNGGSMAYQETMSLQLFGGSRKLVDDLLGEAHAASFPKTPGVSILTARNECWYASSWQPKRPLPSLVLADQVLGSKMSTACSRASARRPKTRASR